MTRQKYPEPTVGALILNPEKKILLVRSHKWRNKYVIPGGHIELGETNHEALTREVKEETGLDVYDIEYIGFQEFIYDQAFWKKRHFIFFDYACKTEGGEVKLNDESEEFIWVNPEEAHRLPVEPYTLHTIDEYLKKR